MALCGSCGPPETAATTDGNGDGEAPWWEDAFGYWSDTFFVDAEAQEPDDGAAPVVVRRPNWLAWLALFWLLFTLWYLIFRER